MKQLSLFDPIEITLSNGLIALVDPIDADLSSSHWHPSQNMPYSTYYAIGTVNGVIVPMHRFILQRMLNRTLARFELCDHRDLNGLNNRRDNLRLASPSQNIANASRYPRCNDLPCGVNYKGVSYIKKSGRYIANITVMRKTIWLGSYADPADAARAYDAAAVERFGEFARTNAMLGLLPASASDTRA